MNFYAYCKANPLNFSDPYGLCPSNGDKWDPYEHWGEINPDQLFQEPGSPFDGLKELQPSLDAIGFFDPSGIADGLNALLYLLQGQWGYSGISAASILPFGDILKGGKYGGKIFKTGKEACEAQKGIRSLEKRIAEHESKLTKFKANPTVRPGMENLPKEIIEKQQQARIKHLEDEIRAFRDSIEKLRKGRQ